MIKGVGTERFTNHTLIPSFANTSQDQKIVSFDKNLLSYPITIPVSATPSDCIFIAIALANIWIFAFVNSSPIIALHPPVPNRIIIAPPSFVFSDLYYLNYKTFYLLKE